MPERRASILIALVDMERRGRSSALLGASIASRSSDPNPELGQLAEATLWADRRGTLSHDTVLDLHELCDIDPAQIHITIPTAYRLQKSVPKLYRVHRNDLEKGERTFYEGIPIVTPYRAIRDGIETGIRADLLRQAIDTARRRGQVRGPQLRRLRKMLAARGRREFPVARSTRRAARSSWSKAASRWSFA